MPKTIERQRFIFTENRPWTHEFFQDNFPGKQVEKVFVEPIEKWSWFRGDRVEIMTGPDKGKQGIINQIIEERNWVFVQGLNCKLKTIGQTKTFPGIVTKVEKPLLVGSFFLNFFAYPFLSFFSIHNPYVGHIRNKISRSIQFASHRF